jgi:hypothetical protein
MIGVATACSLDCGVVCSPVGTCSNLYKEKLQQYVENKYVQESTGFKPLAETINGRAAMLVSTVPYCLNAVCTVGLQAAVVVQHTA